MVQGALFPPAAHTKETKRREDTHNPMDEKRVEKDPGRLRVSQVKITSAGVKTEQDGNTCYIIFIKTGNCIADCKGDTLTLTAGSILLLGRACSCILRATGHITPESVGCAFPHTLCNELFSVSQKDYSFIFAKDRPIALHGSAQIVNRLRTLLELMRSAIQEPDFPGKQYLSLLLHYVEREYLAESRSEQRPRNDTVERICAYLSTHYTQRLTLTDVAAQFYLSPYYLSRLFRQVTGQSIVDYINAQRIEAAQHLLEETDLRINAVAEQTGFATTAHFRRVFRELLGVSPQQYRKNHTGNYDGS